LNQEITHLLSPTLSGECWMFIGVAIQVSEC
jgi:hypothetical protein